MTVEASTYINTLNASYPAATDPKSEGDDHIRAIKSAVKLTFPNVTGAVTATQSELNSVTEKVTGPASATANALAKFDGTTGKLMKVSGVVEDAAGNVGVGSAPGATSGRSIDLNGVSLQPLYTLRASSLTSATAQWTLNAAGSTVDFGSSDFGYRWTVGATSLMTLDASGNLLVGTTTPVAAERFGVASSTVSGQVQYLYASSASFDGTVQVLNSARSATTGYYFTRAFANGSAVYGVFGNGNVVNTNNSYGAISDLKLKDNIVDVTPKLAKLLQVRIVNYTLKADPNKTKLIGVIAQELEQISPGLIEETPDYEEVTRTREVEVPAVDAVVDADGNEVTPAVPASTKTEEYTERVATGTFTKSVKYSVFVPMLIKGMQEQQAQIEAMQAQIDAQNTAMQLLASRLAALEAV